MAVRVNGELIEDAVIRQEAAALRPRYEEMMAGTKDPVEMEVELREWSRENVIERVLLQQEARKDPEPVPAEVIDEALSRMTDLSSGQPGCLTPEQEKMRDEVELQIRMERLIRKVTEQTKPPKPKEAGDYYKKNKERFRTPEVIRCSHIVKHVNENTDDETARKAIEDAMEKLKAGGDFAAIADELSDCPGNGGYLGDVVRDQMVEEFEEVIFGLGEGETSGTFKTIFGWHIARVHERIPEGVRGFQEVKGDIEEELMREKREKTLEQYLDKLRAAAVVENVKSGQAK